MTILIDNKSGQPIYEQIVDQIREQILTGALGADEALPSIRSQIGRASCRERV